MWGGLLPALIWVRVFDIRVSLYMIFMNQIYVFVGAPSCAAGDYMLCILYIYIYIYMRFVRWRSMYMSNVYWLKAPCAPKWFAFEFPILKWTNLTVKVNARCPMYTGSRRPVHLSDWTSSFLYANGRNSSSKLAQVPEQIEFRIGEFLSAAGLGVD